MKKILVYIFFIFFSLANTSYSEDIRNLQIEGMSVGDDVTDYFSLSTLAFKTKKIENGSFNFWIGEESMKSKLRKKKSEYSYGEVEAEAEIGPVKLFETTVSSDQFETYDSVSVIYYGKNKASFWQRIKSITGLIYYKNNFEKCKVNKQEAVRDISKIVQSVFVLDSGGGIVVSCYDYKKSLELIGAKDALMVTIAADLEQISRPDPPLKTSTDLISTNAQFIKIKPQQVQIDRPKF